MGRKAGKDARDRFKYQARCENSHMGPIQLGVIQYAAPVTRPHSDAGRPVRA